MGDGLVDYATFADCKYLREYKILLVHHLSMDLSRSLYYGLTLVDWTFNWTNNGLLQVIEIISGYGPFWSLVHQIPTYARPPSIEAQH